MRFSCDECGAQYMIADEKVGTRGVKVKCKKCSHIIVVRPAAQQEAVRPAAQQEAVRPAAQQEAEQPEAPAQQQPSAPEASGQAPGGNDESAPAAGLGQEQQEGGGAFGAVFGDNPFNATTQAIDADQLASLRQKAAGSEEAGPTIPPPADESSQPGGELPSTAGTPGFGDAFGNWGDRTVVGSTPDLGALAGMAPEASTPETSTQAPASSTAPASAKEWYVAIDDSQVGPIDIPEIEQRWDGLELDEDSLAWKAGMSDWLPVAEIPELAYMVTERPQQRAPAPGSELAAGGGVSLGLGAAATSSAGAAAGATNASSASPGLGAASMSPVAFGSGGNGAGEDVAWKPSAASALSSLVQEELVASTAPKGDAAAPAAPAANAPPAGMDMPSFGAGDLFGAGAQAGGAAAAAPLPSVGGGGADTFGGPVGGGWSVPQASKGSGEGGGKGTMIGVAVAAGVLLLGGVGFLAVKVLQQPSHAAPVASAPPPTQPPAQPGQPRAVTPPPQQPQTRPTVTSRPSPPKPSPPSRAGGSSRPPRKPTPRRPKKNDDLDVFDGPSPRRNVKAKLDKNDVLGGIKKNARSLSPCVGAARKKGEIVPGPYKFLLQWQINPNGSVAGAKLVGPASVMGTSLPNCFKAKMRNWKFPASKQGAPVKYPLKVNVP